MYVYMIKKKKLTEFIAGNSQVKMYFYESIFNHCMYVLKVILPL